MIDNNNEGHKNHFLTWRIVTEFIRLETSSGIILFIAAILALIFANSPWQDHYHTWFHREWSFSIMGKSIATTAIFWINDFLMAIFFLLVGLEIKREILVGELNSIAKISLPAVAALGGMIVPAIIYLSLNHQSSAFDLKGWAIPTATDIAFALGIMALLGKRIPLSAKLFLMALAIFDDVGAIVIIAVFYSTQIVWPALLSALVCVLVLAALNYFRITRIWPYVLIGLVLWVLLFQSGVHPTLAGVLLALTIPLHTSENKTRRPYNDSEKPNPLDWLEQVLHPWVAYLILPIFSFANAGVSFGGFPLQQLFTPLSMGIFFGLFLGKQIGVFGSTWLAIRLRWAPMPNDANWLTLYGTAIICGVGFTMSLFIGQLAFQNADSTYPALVRFGVLSGSFLSGVVGYFMLRWGCQRLP